MTSILFFYVCADRYVYFERQVVDRCVSNERENSCCSSSIKKKKIERELWKCSLKCVCARAASSLSLALTMYDVFWNSIKSECVWHKTSERKCVKKNEKETWENHTSLFKQLNSWYIVQYSSSWLVCFSLSTNMISILTYSRLKMNRSIYIGHGCKQASLFNNRWLLLFSLSLSLIWIVCLRQWLFFHFQKVYVCMYV
jgi:hypothetical protein